MGNEGKILNGPLAGLAVKGRGHSYDFGGIGIKVLCTMPTPLGTVLWRPERGGGWEWIDRKPLPIECP
jgi:hypothetical protein